MASWGMVPPRVLCKMGMPERMASLVSPVPGRQSRTSALCNNREGFSR